MGDDLKSRAIAMREELNDTLPNGVGNTVDALVDRIALLEEALGPCLAALEAATSGVTYRNVKSAARAALSNGKGE